MNKQSPHLARQARGSAESAGKSMWVTAPDGLRLHVREYGSRDAPGIPVVCLPGLARSVADFYELAPALAFGTPARHVVAIDSRGRGDSDHDPDHTNYNCTVELGDIVGILIQLGVGPAIFVGSSRGGVLTMLCAVAYPSAIAGVVLHDIGPVTESKGMARIKGYLGKLPHPRSFEEGAKTLRDLLGAHFPKLSTEQWMAGARLTWQMKHGALMPAYDLGIARALAGIDVEGPMPTFWNEFDALASVPMLVIRGANSDMLSAETVAAMRTRRGEMDVIEVPDQGHAPLLEGELVRKIVSFVEKCEAARQTAGTAK